LELQKIILSQIDNINNRIKSHHGCIAIFPQDLQVDAMGDTNKCLRTQEVLADLVSILHDLVKKKAGEK
jgi:hypothetical protein